MDQDKIEEGMLMAQEGMLLNRINIQVLLQLLVEKEVITREEVAYKREYVGNQPMYKNSLDGIHNLQSKNYDNQLFSCEFEKYLRSKGKDGNIDFYKR